MRVPKLRRLGACNAGPPISVQTGRPRNKALTLRAVPEFVSATAYAAAAKRKFGEPTTPLFCIPAFTSSEPNQVRAFATSATS